MVDQPEGQSRSHRRGRRSQGTGAGEGGGFGGKGPSLAETRREVPRLRKLSEKDGAGDPGRRAAPRRLRAVVVSPLQPLASTCTSELVREGLSNSIHDGFVFSLVAIAFAIIAALLKNIRLEEQRPWKGRRISVAAGSANGPAKVASASVPYTPPVP